LYMSFLNTEVIKVA